MAKNIKYPFIEELFELRKKEVLDGLTYEEMRRVSMLSDEIDKTLSNKTELYTKESQMKSEMMVVSIRRPRFKEKVVKQTFFEKLQKKEPIVYYELALYDENDLQYGYYSYEFLLSVRKFMSEVGLENEWFTIVTPTFEIEGGFEFHFSKKEKEWLEQLPDPVESLRMLNKVKDIEERARMHSKEMLDFIQCIKRYLEEDYVIYIDYTELQYIEIG